MSCWGAPADLKGGVESLQKYELPTPIISKPREVLVKVSAASLNPLDINMLGETLRASMENLADISEPQVL